MSILKEKVGDHQLFNSILRFLWWKGIHLWYVASIMTFPFKGNVASIKKRRKYIWHSNKIEHIPFKIKIEKRLNTCISISLKTSECFGRCLGLFLFVIFCLVRENNVIINLNNTPLKFENESNRTSYKKLE